PPPPRPPTARKSTLSRIRRSVIIAAKPLSPRSLGAEFSMLRPLTFSGLLLALIFCSRGIAEEAVEFPLPYFEDALYLPVTIDGDDHLFLLDTGATVNTFHT